MPDSPITEIVDRDGAIAEAAEAVGGQRFDFHGTSMHEVLAIVNKTKFIRS